MMTDYTNIETDWWLAIAEKHNLIDRCDEPLAAVIVLLLDAAKCAKIASHRAFAEQAITAETLHIVEQSGDKLQDALRVVALCSNVPSAGDVRKLKDGSLRWRPTSKSENTSVLR